MTSPIVGHIDLALMALYAFWIFFFGLLFYLRREDRREGFPLVSDITGKKQGGGILWIPAPKKFNLPHGGKQISPRKEPLEVVENAVPVAGFPGAPLQPTGNPMVDGVGPASYAKRADHPDVTIDGSPKLLPLRVATDFSIAENDPDPRGMQVVTPDHRVAGTISDVWVDRSEFLIRYLEVAVDPAYGGRTVLIPQTLATIHGNRRVVEMNSVMAKHFADAPMLKDPNLVTLLEEDKICAYFASGYLYATPGRLGPLL